MGDTVWMNAGLVGFFILLGGFFAAAELALVSLRDSQLDTLEQRGKRGAVVAKLARDPNTFLAAVQIGVTVSGFFSAAFGAAALAPVLADPLRQVGIDPQIAGVTAVVVLTLLIAYLSLVFGELAPKRLALQRSESFALALAPVVATLAVALRPLIWLVSRSSDAVVRMVGGNPQLRSEGVSDEELQSLVESHQGFDDTQREILSDVISSASQRLSSVVRPRADIEFLREDMRVEDAREWVFQRPFSRYPVVQNELDDCRQFVHVRDLMAPTSSTATVGERAREIPLLPSTMTVLPAITRLREEGKHIALVVDEYGGVDGLVTLEDLIEQLIGEVFDEHDPADLRLRAQLPKQRGRHLGSQSLRRFADESGVTIPDGPYSTIAGFVLSELGRIPAVGESVTWGPHTFTVLSMEGRRITELELASDSSSVTSPPM